jgi:hypothetical protein
MYLDNPNTLSSHFEVRQHDTSICISLMPLLDVVFSLQGRGL